MKIQNIHFQRIFFALNLLVLFGFGIQKSNAQTVNVTGPISMEVDQQSTFSVTNSGTKYWGVSSGASIISGQGSNNVLIKATTGSNFTITVSINGGSSGYGGKTVEVIPSVPSTPSIEYQNCGAELVSAVENISGVTWYWQGTSSTGTNTNYPSTSNYPVLASGNYYLRARNSGGKWSINSAGKSVTMPTTPSIPIISGSASREICLGGSSTFSISTPLSGGTYIWYSGTTQVGSGTSFTANPASSGNKIYTVKVTSNQGCESNAKTLTLNVIDLSTPIRNNGQNTCLSGNTVVVSANNSRTVNGQVRTDMEHVWYSNSSLTTIVSSQTVSGTPNGTIATQKTVTLSAGQSQSFWVVSKIGGCVSSPIQVTAQSVDFTLNAGGIGGIDTVCYNTDPNNLTSTSSATGGDGQNFSYKWQYSINGSSNWVYITGATNTSYNPTTNLTSDRWYRREVTSCEQTVYSNTVKITVNPALSSPGSITGDQTICYNTDPSTLNGSNSPSGGDGYFSYQWEWSSNGTNGWNPISSTNSSSYNPSTILTANRWYRRGVSSCGQTSYTNAVKVTVTPQFTDGGSISEVPDVCYNTDANILNNSAQPTGGNGNYSYLWQYSNNESSGWINILGSTSSSFNPSTNLTSDRWYRRSAISCGQTAYSNAVKVTVLPIPSAPATTSASNTCESASIQLTANSSNSGTVTHKWYNASSGNTTISHNIISTIGNYVTGVTVNAQSVTYYVSTVVDGCESAREPVTATYNPTGTAPTLSVSDVSTSTDRCGSGDFILSASGGYAGSEYQWYENQTGGNSIITGSGYSFNLSYANTINGEKTYWVGGTLVNAQGCSFTITQRQPIIINLDNIPNEPNPQDGARCSTGSVELSATGNDLHWFANPTGGTELGAGLTFNTPSISTTTPFYVEARNANGCVSDRVAVQANITDGFDWYLDADGDNYAITSQIACENPGVGWTQAVLPLTDCDDTDGNINPETVWRLDADGDGHAIDSQTTCASPGPDWTYEGIPIDDCDDNNEHVYGSITWYTDSDNDGYRDPSGGTTQQSCMDPGDFWTQDPTYDNCPTIYDTSNYCESVVDVQYSGQNYVYSRSYVKPSSQVPGAKFLNSEDYIQNITYFDGHGRAIQEIAIGQSTSGQDIVKHIEYDALGRMPKEYLPYAETDGNNGSLRYSAKPNTEGFYDTSYFENTTNPFSETLFEESPLNRSVKAASPGNSWAMGNGHEMKSDYMTNLALDNVKWFMVNLNESNGDFIPTLEINTNTFYGAGKLTKNIIKDENWEPADNKLHTIEQFTNSRSQVILKRHYGPIDINKDGDTLDPGEQEVGFDSYYVYDDYGNLTFVLPPLMNASTESLASIIAGLDELAYQYTYDNRNRLVEKQLPGKEKEYIIYNNLDKPIMVQDAVQHATGEWLFTKYDAFGRLAYTGKAVDTRSRKDIQNEVNGLSIQLWVSKGSYTNDGEEIGYLNSAYPTTTLTEVLTINYYDDYSFETAGATPPSFVFDEEIDFNVKGLATGSKIKVLDVSPAQWITNITYYQEKARPIYGYSLNEFLGTVDITETDMDFAGKPLKVRTTHERGSNSLVTIDFFEYDFTGRLLKQTQCINGDCGTGTPVVANAVYQNETITTDKVATTSITILPTTTITGNLTLKIDPNATIGGNTEPILELITYNKYDEIGQLVEKKVGGSPNTDYVTTIGLQTVNFGYNVRGWLKGINNETGTNQNVVLGTTDLFGYQINYDSPYNFGAGQNPDALFNGNIAQVLWKTTSVNLNTGNQVAERYSYSYDALNRLTQATDNTTNNNYGLGFITYDKNGNIERLQRRGHVNGTYSSFGTMDDLVYTYSGNQLTRVDDNTLLSFGFNDRSPGATDYRYDVNGNMVVDQNKYIGNDITNGISYNHLNLPVNINVNGSTDDGTINYIYDAVGNKLQKSVTPNSQSSLTTDYALGYIYENGNLQFFNTPEGYVAVEPNDEYSYIYQFKDHLGNIRLSYTDDPSNPGTATIIEENNYYPFGLKHKGYNMGGDNSLGNDLAQKWKFGGKELDESLNGILNSYDFGARNYDPELGRWMNIDPLAEKMRRHSPYNYAFDNPILFMDPDGMAPQQATDGYGNKISITSNSAWSVASMNIEHTDSNGNKTKVSISISDFNDVINSNKQGQTPNCDTCPKNKIDLNDASTLYNRIILWGRYILKRSASGGVVVHPEQMVILKEGEKSRSLGEILIGVDDYEYEALFLDNEKRLTVRINKHYYHGKGEDSYISGVISDNLMRYDKNKNPVFNLSFISSPGHSQKNGNPHEILYISFEDINLRNRIMDHIEEDVYREELPDGKYIDHPKY